jgi:hypothetical protein
VRPCLQRDAGLLRTRGKVIDVLRRLDVNPDADALLPVPPFLPVVLAIVSLTVYFAYRDSESPLAHDGLRRPVIVAVRSVNVVQMSRHDVVGVSAVRDGRVAAVRPVRVRWVVSVARMIRRAAIRILLADGNRMSHDASSLV